MITSSMALLTERDKLLTQVYSAAPSSSSSENNSGAKKKKKKATIKKKNAAEELSEDKRSGRNLDPAQTVEQQRKLSPKYFKTGENSPLLHHAWPPVRNSNRYLESRDPTTIGPITTVSASQYGRHELSAFEHEAFENKKRDREAERLRRQQEREEAERLRREEEERRRREKEEEARRREEEAAEKARLERERLAREAQAEKDRLAREAEARRLAEEEAWRLRQEEKMRHQEREDLSNEEHALRKEIKEAEAQGRHRFMKDFKHEAAQLLDALEAAKREQERLREEFVENQKKERAAIEFDDEDFNRKEILQDEQTEFDKLKFDLDGELHRIRTEHERREREAEEERKRVEEEERRKKEEEEREKERLRLDEERRLAAEKAMEDARRKKAEEEEARRKAEEEYRLAKEKEAHEKEMKRRAEIEKKFKEIPNVVPSHLIMPTERSVYDGLYELATDFRGKSTEPPTAEKGGITEPEFIKAVNVLWPGNKHGAQIASRSFKYAVKDTNGTGIKDSEEFAACLQFVVYSNNLAPLFEGVDSDREGVVEFEEFEHASEHFEIRNAAKAWKGMKKFIKQNFKVEIGEEEQTVPFDFFLFFLSREHPFFDIELAEDEEEEEDKTQEL